MAIHIFLLISQLSFCIHMLHIYDFVELPYPCHQQQFSISPHYKVLSQKVEYVKYLISFSKSFKELHCELKKGLLFLILPLQFVQSTKRKSSALKKNTYNRFKLWCKAKKTGPWNGHFWVIFQSWKPEGILKNGNNTIF